VHGEIKKVVVTSVVMRHLFIVPGAPRAFEDFCDPNAVSRIIGFEIDFFVFHTAPQPFHKHNINPTSLVPSIVRRTVVKASVVNCAP